MTQALGAISSHITKGSTKDLRTNSIAHLFLFLIASLSFIFNNLLKGNGSNRTPSRDFALVSATYDIPVAVSFDPKLTKTC